MEINENREVAETDNDELVVDAANDAPPPQDAPTATMTMVDATEEGGDDDDMGAEDGDGNDKADNTKGGEEGGGESHG